MFTGIVEELGKIQNITSKEITIECKTVLEDAKLGDSIAINGICLTVVKLNSTGFTADISPETYRVTTLKDLTTGDYVNLERAIAANGRFGGHIVSGHIDGQGKFLSAEKKGEFYDLRISVPYELTKYIVKKGSIAINGISLTIANINSDSVNLAIIPHTFENTGLKYLKSGSFVNIEVDILAKYIEKFLSPNDNKSRLDLNFLQENGFV